MNKPRQCGKCQAYMGPWDVCPVCGHHELTGPTPSGPGKSLRERVDAIVAEYYEKRSETGGPILPGLIEAFAREVYEEGRVAGIESVNNKFDDLNTCDCACCGVVEEIRTEGEQMTKKIRDVNGKELEFDSQGRLVSGPITDTETYVRVPPAIFKALAFLVEKRDCRCDYAQCERCQIIEELGQSI